ncbi:MAG: tRNA preQ1(34) S-adenosylmethionine ribosyltransferase-isomerase QueA [Blastocatellia bacterium]|nr:MAG: tRNA preQ1(34) S-adenosylmethionine ribosyltransferase-isomerase QueA [Blastocatellia bacterium]
MNISEFDYELPEELIAQEPLDQRDASRMLVLDRAVGTWIDSTFRQFPEYLHPTDTVVINNTRVIPARLIGKRKGSGGRVEIFLVRELEPAKWQALIKPGRRLHAGSIVVFDHSDVTAELLDDPTQDLRLVLFHSKIPFEQALARIGSTPLPPYIKRPSGASPSDRERYQTVYSKQDGAIAAPTAGLHFTPEVLAETKKCAQVVEITLHVGYGTFEPVRVNDISEHAVSAERYEISPAAAKRVNNTKQNGGRVVVVGTTTMRALEGATDDQNVLVPGSGETKLTIKPGYKFRIADVLLTNFHLPQSSLLLLVSAFARREFVLAAYRHAVQQRYRFYSYGDCMLIL